MNLSALPDITPAHKAALDRAIVAANEGDFFSARQLYAQLTRVNKHPAIAMMAAQLSLLLGDYEKAWPLFEQRLAMDYYNMKPFARQPEPLWDGRPLEKERLFIIADQGVGDVILLTRFLPWVMERASNVELQVPELLTALLARHFPNIQVRPISDERTPCDFRVNMFSLPLLAGAQTPARIPAAPYMTAEESRTREWSERLRGARHAVALAWQGNPDQGRDFERSVALETLLPLLRIKDVTFVSVQIGPGHDQLHSLPAGLFIESLQADILADEGGMEATSAILASVDLTISVCSAVANLAGAMGAPLWLMGCKIPDWRWQAYPSLDPARPEPQPWYEPERIYRCHERLDWSSPVRRMAADLAARVVG